LPDSSAMSSDCAPGELRLEDLVQLVTMGQPIPLGGEPRILGKLAPACGRAQPLPGVKAPGAGLRAKEELAVRGEEVPVGRAVGKQRAELVRQHTGAGVVHDVAPHELDGRVVKGRVDPLAPSASLPLDQRDQHADGQVGAGLVVDDSGADSDRAAAAFTGDALRPGIGLQDSIGAPASSFGSSMTETRHARVDDLRTGRRDRFISDPQALRYARPVVLHQDVGRGDELVGDAQSGGVFEVKHDPPLVPHVVGGEPTVRKAVLAALGSARVGGPVGRGPGRPGGLDLNHVGAEVAQHLGAEWPGGALAEVQHPDTVQWHAWHAPSSPG
jgi:hypothetical protein